MRIRIARRTIAVFAAAAAAFAAELPSQVDKLYSVSSADGTLRAVTIVYSATIETRPIVRSTGANAERCHGLARDPVTGLAYAFVTFVGGTSQELCRLDLDTGVATPIGVMTDTFQALACRADGTLFAAKDAAGAAPAELHTIDALTAQPTFVMALPAGTDGEAIVFAPDLSLYRASGRGAPNVDEVLERIDATTHATTNVPLSGADYDGLTVLASYTGRFLLGVDRGNHLYVLTTAGHVEHFGLLDHGPVTGLVFVPSSDTAPFFRQFGDACTAASGAAPMLMGCGLPSGGHNPGVHLRYAPSSAVGLLAIGADDGAVSFPSVACQAQIVPVFYVTALAVDPAGDFNTWFQLAVGTPPNDLFFQVAVLDATNILVSNPVQMHIR